MQLDGRRRALVHVAEHQGVIESTGEEAIADAEDLDSGDLHLLDLILALLACQLLLENVASRLHESPGQGGVAPLDNENDGLIPFAGPCCRDDAASREAIQQLGPGRAEFLLEVGDQLLKAFESGRVEQLAVLVEAAELPHGSQADAQFEGLAWLAELDHQIGGVGDQPERVGFSRGALWSGDEPGEEEERQWSGAAHDVGSWDGLQEVPQ
jgi:hypothetical protein